MGFVYSLVKQTPLHKYNLTDQGKTYSLLLANILVTPADLQFHGILVLIFLIYFGFFPSYHILFVFLSFFPTCISVSPVFD